MRMQDVFKIVSQGDAHTNELVTAIMSAWAECVEEIHPTAGVCVDKSKVSE